MSDIEVSVVIPCLNEEENVQGIYDEVSAELAQHARSWEILFIDNGSTDRTRELIRAICGADTKVRAIFNTRNFGQMRSPTHAIYQAEGAAVIGMCADFQDPPQLLGEFIRQWRDGRMIVLGVRRSEEKAGALLTAARKAGYGFLARNADYAVIPGATGFGLYDRRVVDTLARWHEPEPFFRGMLVESGFSIGLVPYDRPERRGGQTKNDVFALLDFAVSGLAGSSKALLRRPIVWSFGFMALGLVLAAVAVAAAFTGAAAWPWVILASQFGLFGFGFLFTGLLGEQVRIIAERTRRVPLVIEQERLNFPASRTRPVRQPFVVAEDA
ncbi:glycosyltransferase family 2 protein [Novosphingobium sp.]|uniref:glycosyltransferase family 2 protein n=1 Tax=Novosphingobium sp. TaxID=1874826 RepID=UPI00261BB4F8|nr:glycosyltransferase family 2 protein [Novosphingobium sp.]